ncbi:hypothetical protein QTI17_30545 [Variovorax sp. J31P179]|uniref:hypothetical protein n=1 Tax=Variovorax sp. J31P179 TaxID=3053508 RepID=UPI00257507C6|nr:hypothetical protein [Variovorax sp. J31P179]MDM0084944.1 hypothetical protein [Variovorax sp. J31P179]
MFVPVKQTNPEEVLVLMQGSRFGVPVKPENKDGRAVTTVGRRPIDARRQVRGQGRRSQGMLTLDEALKQTLQAFGARMAAATEKLGETCRASRAGATC